MWAISSFFPKSVVKEHLWEKCYKWPLSHVIPSLWNICICLIASVIKQTPENSLIKKVTKNKIISQKKLVFKTKIYFGIIIWTTHILLNRGSNQKVLSWNIDPGKVNNVILLLLLLTLSWFYTWFWFFHCWLWTSWLRIF